MECHSEHGDYRGQFRASGLGAMQVVVTDVMPITLEVLATRPARELDVRDWGTGR